MIAIMNHLSSGLLAMGAAAILLGAGCASESHRTLDTEPVKSHGAAYSGPKYALGIGNFENRSTYMRGIFTGEGRDKLGSQARTILKTHLSQTGRFTLVDRENMDEASREAGLRGEKREVTGAQVLISGRVTEFGRKEVGDHWLWGILGRGKRQIAYSKVSLNVVDVRTSEVLFSVQGAGEFELSDREVIGFGGTSGYDATLNDKVLNFVITDAVNKLVDALEARQWSPTTKDE